MKFPNSVNTVARVMAATTLSSCTVVVQSNKLEDKVSAETGIVYYLPMRPIKVEVVRAPIPPAEKVQKAKDELKTATDNVTKAKVILAAAKNRLENATTAKESLVDLKKAIENAETDLTQATKAEAKAKAAVTAATIEQVKASDDAPSFQDTITLTLLSAVADTKHRYSAELKHHLFRSDDLKLTTTPEGLLSTSTAKSEDQSLQILVEVAKSLSGVRALEKKTISTRYSVPIEIPGTTPVTKDIQCGFGMKRDQNAAQKPFKFEYTFNPTADKVMHPMVVNGALEEREINPWSYVSSSLCALGADYHFVLSSVTSTVEPDLPEASVPKNMNGLLYRRVVPYQLDIYKGTRIPEDKTKTPETIDTSINNWTSIAHVQTSQFNIPNGSPIELLPMDGGLFTSRQFNAEFKEGILISNSYDRPSEALAVTKVPLEIAKAIISIPAEIISLKIDYSSEEKALVDGQTELLKSKKQYQDTKKEIENSHDE